ncbi:hypothetical protein [Rheinheimera sp.]|uniref:hypothetical protein n=1 Tax=Rheinheimera sp. TaxID=1869214 RepID=UPI0027B88FD9|nr:hypothetical protein [Rheinheimera sp.]
MRLIILTLTLLLSLRLSATELILIAHQNNTNKLEQHSLIQLYLNKTSTFADGSAAVIFHSARDSEQHQQFCLSLLNLTAAQYQSYWSRLIFTGAAARPHFVLDDTEMLKNITTNKSAIGYISAQTIPKDVRVIGYLTKGKWQSVP